MEAYCGLSGVTGWAVASTDRRHGHWEDSPLLVAIQLWGTASTSNIEILERFQSKAWRMIVDASTVIRRALQTPTVKEEIRRYSSQYSARLSAHPNGLVVNLMERPDKKAPAKWSAYQIPSVTVAFVVLVCKV
jgi:hypothetical protein